MLVRTVREPGLPTGGAGTMSSGSRVMWRVLGGKALDSKTDDTIISRVIAFPVVKLKERQRS